MVVMNPTHYAVALRYEQGETPAPQCVAKGVDAVALQIREVAEEAGVPVIEDPPLARALYATVEVDQIIPHQHYEAVAKIIGFILAGKRPRQRARARLMSVVDVSALIRRRIGGNRPTPGLRGPTMAYPASGKDVRARRAAGWLVPAAARPVLPGGAAGGRRRP